MARARGVQAVVAALVRRVAGRAARRFVRPACRRSGTAAALPADSGPPWPSAGPSWSARPPRCPHEPRICVARGSWGATSSSRSSPSWTSRSFRSRCRRRACNCWVQARSSSSLAAESSRPSSASSRTARSFRSTSSCRRGVVDVSVGVVVVVGVVDVSVGVVDVSVGVVDVSVGGRRRVRRRRGRVRRRWRRRGAVGVVVVSVGGGVVVGGRRRRRVRRRWSSWPSASSCPSAVASSSAVGVVVVGRRRRRGRRSSSSCRSASLPSSGSEAVAVVAVVALVVLAALVEVVGSRRSVGSALVSASDAAGLIISAAVLTTAADANTPTVRRRPAAGARSTTDGDRHWKFERGPSSLSSLKVARGSSTSAGGTEKVTVQRSAARVPGRSEPDRSTLALVGRNAVAISPRRTTSEACLGDRARARSSPTSVSRTTRPASSRWNERTRSHGTDFQRRRGDGFCDDVGRKVTPVQWINDSHASRAQISVVCSDRRAGRLSASPPTASRSQRPALGAGSRRGRIPAHITDV